MADKRISERELILPALYILSQQDAITTSQLIEQLTALLKPTGEDAEILASRRDTKFSQKVRNLVSHRSLVDQGYAEYEHQGKNGIHRLLDHGRQVLSDNREVLAYLLGDDFEYADQQIALTQVADIISQGKKALAVDENIVIEEGAKRARNAQIYERSQRLRNAAIERYIADGHIKCQACGFDFLEVYGEVGKGFIEIHHQKPIFQYEDEDQEKFLGEALKNVIPLCSNCHRMIHRRQNQPLSIAELRALLQREKL